jgi:hypothetical protein
VVKSDGVAKIDHKKSSEDKDDDDKKLKLAKALASIQHDSDDELWRVCSWNIIVFYELWQSICTMFVFGSQIIQFASVFLIYSASTQFSNSKTYIPKSRRSRFSKLASEYCGLLRSWIKKQFDNVEVIVYKSMKTTQPKFRMRQYSKTKSNKGRWQVRHLALTTKTKQQTPKRQMKKTQFDTDSKSIKVDNCATATISNSIDDFEGPVMKTNYWLQGIRGLVGEIMTGTVVWHIEDDEGVVHTLKLPESLYVASLPTRILSPQHWAQTAKDNKLKPDGTWCATYFDRVELCWSQQQFKRTIRLDPSHNNVATIHTAPGYSRFQAFLSQVDMTNDDLVVYEVERATDDKTDSVSNGTVHNETGSITHAEIQREHPEVTSFDLDGKNGAVVQPIIEHGDDTHHGNVAAEFLKWHHRLGHISPRKIQLMAKEGRLPAKLASCNIPMCTSCMYGKATKQPWRSKAPPNQIKSICTFPGQCVSIDQQESSTPGLIAQLRGIPTHRQYRVATVFVDHYSGLGYVHLQQSTSALETIEAKSAFERFAMEQGASVSHYHADNGCFADNLFQQAVRE